jgi:hypothetical protein
MARTIHCFSVRISFSHHCLYTVKILRTNMYDGVQTVNDLLFLPNNVASEAFVHKSGAMRNWMFIVGAAAWRWLGEYVILDKMFYNIRFTGLEGP